MSLFLIIAASLFQRIEASTQRLKSEALSIALDHASLIPSRFEEPYLFSLNSLAEKVSQYLPNDVPQYSMPIAIIGSNILNVSIRLNFIDDLSMSVKGTLRLVECGGNRKMSLSGPEVVFKFSRALYVHERLYEIFSGFLIELLESAEIRSVVADVCSVAKQSSHNDHLEMQFYNLRDSFYSTKSVELIPSGDLGESACIITEKSHSGVRKFYLHREASIDPKYRNIYIKPLPDHISEPTQQLRVTNCLEMIFNFFTGRQQSHPEFDQRIYYYDDEPYKQYSTTLLHDDWCSDIAKRSALSIEDIYKAGLKY